MTFRLRLSVVVAALGLLLPYGAYAAPQTFAQFVYFLISFINPIAEILAMVAVLIFFWGIFQYIYSAGDEGHEKGRQLIVWGVIGLFVLFSVWSLASIVVQTFFGSSAGGYTGGSTVGTPVPTSNLPAGRAYLNTN